MEFSGYRWCDRFWPNLNGYENLTQPILSIRLNLARHTAIVTGNAAVGGFRLLSDRLPRQHFDMLIQA